MPTYTVSNMIDRALRTIGVLASGESPTAEQQEDALDSLNDLLNEWDTKGIGGGFEDATAATELVLDPDEYRALRLALAADLAVEYQIVASPALLMSADQAMRLLEAKYCRPATLCADDIQQSEHWDIETD